MRGKLKAPEVTSSFDSTADGPVFEITKVQSTVTGDATGDGTLKGAMAFDRKRYGMNSGIPFIKIADRVEVDLDLNAKRVSGPPVNLK